MLTNSEHRQCARHVYANFSKKWGGVYFKSHFWQAAKACYPQLFQHILEKIKVGNVEAYNYLLAKLPYTWTRAFYKTVFECDAVENGICECWNSMIRDTRKKPIIHMLEDIRRIVMSRLDSQKKEGEKWTDPICPNIRLKLEESKRNSRYA